MTRKDIKDEIEGILYSLRFFEASKLEELSEKILVLFESNGIVFIKNEKNNTGDTE